MSEKVVSRIRKRDGNIVPFDNAKITEAVFNAAKSVGEENREVAGMVTEKVINELVVQFDEENVPSVEEIQDTVEKVLMENGNVKTAKAYILYRQERERIREEKRAILPNLEDDSDFNVNQLRIAAGKYLARDEKGEICETPNQMFRRIAKTLAKPDYDQYGKEKGKQWEDEFCKTFSNLWFVPGGRTIANAGLGCNQLANCFVVPVNDSMEEIFESVKNQALIQKTGGGTGFDFSQLRGKGTRVIKSNGVASGPVSFIKVFDAATSVIMQGNRRGANMGVLRIDHPDILDFIAIKDDLNALTNFNLSVGLTDAFMQAVKDDKDYNLIAPHTGKPIKKMSAKMVFDILVQHAWRTGEPGVLFIDTVNKDNKVRNVGDIAATNPCGEVPLLPYEACNLGSVNLDRMITNGEVDWDRLRYTVRTSTRMLDNVIDASTYPLPQITEMVRKTRRIGMGILGFADMLFQLGLPYDSEEGVAMGEKVMEFINTESHKVSQELAEEKGVFPAWEGSDYEKEGIKMRNCALTSIAPTGTLSMLADTSGGVEPNFAICFVKNSHSLGETFVYVNKHLESIAKQRGFYSKALMKKIVEQGTLQGLDEVPEDVRKVFVISHDIEPKWHIKMQSAFQKHVDNAISKTINFHYKATPKEVEDGYMLAWELGCKGCTVYRDGSRMNQVLNIKEVNKKEESEDEVSEETKETEPGIEKVETGKPNVALENPEIVSEVTSSGSEENTSSVFPEEATQTELTSMASGSDNVQSVVQEMQTDMPAENTEVLQAEKDEKICPECGTQMFATEGCYTCPNCAYSPCSLKL
jgi:ribonucleoside-diphosphate reductase alpha chain